MDGGTTNRGRIVMLVDNGVRGDSRVQKTAASAVAAGWEVFLLGRAPGPARRRFTLEGARVRLLPRPAPLHTRRHQLRSAAVRRPLAYANAPAAAYKEQWARARGNDVRFRRAVLDVALRRGEGGPRGVGLRLARGWLRVPGAAARMATHWVALRERQRLRAEEQRRTLEGRLDRFATAAWRALLGKRAWRRLEPHLYDYELAFCAEIDALRPDLIHAHDFRMLGVGARAAVRARAAGREVKLVWDAHEYVPGLKAPHHRWLPGLRAWEREHAPFADAVVTVSPPLAEQLRRDHALPELPTVVYNAPVTALTPEQRVAELPNLRAQCGVDAQTPLVVYAGRIGPLRGVHTLLAALAELPGLHLALVSKPPSGDIPQAAYEAIVAEGCEDRVHPLPSVPHWQVVPYLRCADAAVSPLVHLPNHEMAVSNKFFEYAQARLPLVTSDVRTMAQLVRTTGHGEVFTAGDAHECAEALRRVLAHPQRYRAAYDKPGLLAQWTWEAQAVQLDQLYTKLLGRPPAPKSSEQLAPVLDLSPSPAAGARR